LYQAIDNGVDGLFGSEVLSGEFNGQQWDLELEGNKIKCGFVIYLNYCMKYPYST